ncbi:hypothetical protein SPSIL_039930 [Sporomusa silvacetica DSM 10669]|uniref:Methionine synthase n=2 Tax=Sporomusa silvacetica TaxID=55504 RepID=A0ABZ3IQ53_9FIRM|nr:cobalamin-dependent protein [Sporomusa silvacetica]OZC16298.1 methionine synthase [Sporomusa silvacetica DSM 10669]
MADFAKLSEAMGNLEEDEVISILRGVMADGGSEAPQAMEACQKGMDIVGTNFESGDYFVSDLIFAGDLMKQAVEILKDALITGDAGGTKTQMIICTVKDDLHDIGKNIVKAMLEAGGFDVIDLGIDVPPEKIIDEVKKTGVRIVALAGVLTLAIESMKMTVEALKAAGLRDSVKVIIGGAPVTEGYCKIVGADAWTINPQIAVQTCKSWAAEA